MDADRFDPGHLLPQDAGKCAKDRMEVFLLGPRNALDKDLHTQSRV
jgi:hypothetical protein